MAQRGQARQDPLTQAAISSTLALLKRCGITANDVAARLGVGHSFISQMKLGARQPSLQFVETLSALACEVLEREEALDQTAFILAQRATLTWQKAILAQAEATGGSAREVQQRQRALQSEQTLTEMDLKELMHITNETIRLTAGLQRLQALHETWRRTGERLVATWEHIRATRYPDGPLWGIVRAEGEETAQRKGTKTRGRGKRTAAKR